METARPLVAVGLPLMEGGRHSDGRTWRGRGGRERVEGGVYIEREEGVWRYGR